jgi:hypothetical protein
VTLAEEKISSLFEGLKIISITGDKNLNGSDTEMRTPVVQVIRIKAVLNLFTDQTNISQLIITILTDEQATQLIFSSGNFDPNNIHPVFYIESIRDQDSSIAHAHIVNYNDIFEIVLPLTFGSQNILDEQDEDITIEMITSNNAVIKEFAFTPSPGSGRFVEFY